MGATAPERFVVKKILGYGLSACTVISCLVLSPAASRADSMPAIAGVFNDPSGCLTRQDTRLFSSCEGTVQVVFPLIIAGSNHTLGVNVTTTLPTGVSCIGQVLRADGVTLVQSTGFVTTPASGNQALSLGAVSVPFAGTVSVTCEMTQGSSINSINW